MSLYGVMRTGGSGMTAQSNKLSTVADNIANVNTTGYKRASTEFSSLDSEERHRQLQFRQRRDACPLRHLRSRNAQFTTSATDLAIQGNGFFVVTDARGHAAFLTRAGSFVPDGQGNLVNAAGFYLMGYNLKNGPPAVVANGLTGLEVVNIGQTALEGNPSTQATVKRQSRLQRGHHRGVRPRLYVEDVARDLRQYRQQGDARHLHVQDGGQHLGYLAGVRQRRFDGRRLPLFERGPGLDTFTFDVSATGKGKLDAASPRPRSRSRFPGGSAFTLDLSNMTQVAADFQFKADGRRQCAKLRSRRWMSIPTAPCTRSTRTERGLPIYTIPLATVPSPDNLAPEVGNVYSVEPRTPETCRSDFAGQSGFGTIKSGGARAVQRRSCRRTDRR